MLPNRTIHALNTSKSDVRAIGRETAPLSQFRIFVTPHSAFVGRDDFVGIKTEAAHRSDTASAATVASPMRFGPGISPKNESSIHGTREPGPRIASVICSWGTNRAQQKCQFMKRLRSIAHDSLACGAVQDALSFFQGPSLHPPKTV